MSWRGITVLIAGIMGSLAMIGYYARSWLGWSPFGRGSTNGSVSAEVGLLILALVLVVLLILVLLGLILAIFRSARREADAKPTPGPAPASDAAEVAPPPEPRQRFSAGALKAGFARSERWLRSRASGPGFRYRVPWIPLIGPPAAGKTTSLAGCGLHLPDGPPFSGVETARAPVNWWFFERGAVLDVASDLVVRPDRPDADPAPADRRLWERFLRLLQRYRPKKPTDGVILALPAPELLAGANGGDANLLVQTAEALYRRLWRLQQVTGIRFPVYFLVTRCEELAGFDAFRNELPDALSRQMFGWSSDQRPGTAVTGDWVREGFETIRRDLTRMQFELLTEGVRPEHRDGVFQFPEALGRLEAPLRTALERLFRQSAYHEAFTLRGIYFTGGDGAFLGDLLDHKVFPEAGLARPLQGALVTRNRRVLTAQVATVLLALILGGGLWWNGLQLREDVRRTTPTIAQINTDVREMKAKQLEGLTGIAFFNILRNEEPFFRESVINLIQGLADVRGLHYPFLPASWVSPIHEQIRWAMTLAYDEIVLKGVYVFLVQRTESLFQQLQTAIRAAPPPSGEVMPVAAAPEFDALRQFVNRVQEHEEFVGEYNDLRDSQSLEGLGRIIEYLFDLRPPESFFEGGQYYYRALEETRYREFDIRAYRMKARQVRMDRFIERMFVHNPVRRTVEALERKLQAFDTRERAEPELPDIRQLLERIGAAQDVIRRPELAWVFRENLDLGTEFNQLLYDIENLDFFGADLRARIEGELSAAFERLQADLRQRETGLTGPLLRQTNGSAALVPALSEPILALQREMEKLSDQAFMAREKGDGTVMVPPGMQVRWSPEPLRQAVDLLSPYQRFARIDLTEFPTPLRATVGEVARANLERQLLARLGRAMHFEPIGVDRSGRPRERDLAAEIDNFRYAAPYLTRILTYADRLDLRDVATVAGEVAYRQVSRLLTDVDILLKAEPLYAVRGGDFSWWEGEARVSLVAFDVADETELDHYLRTQRERVRHLAFQYAEPLVAFATGTGVLRGRQDERRLLRWERILTSLEAAAAQTPENPVAQLEDFIRFRMDEITPLGFFRQIPASERDAQSGNFFLAHRNRLRRELYARAQALSRDHVRAAWAKLRDRFTRLLAGRYPFAAARDGGGAEVTPEALRDFFRMFQQDADGLRSLLRATAEPGAEEKNVLDFLDQMTKVRDFFGPFLAEPPMRPAPSEGTEPAAEDGGAAEESATAAEDPPEVPAFDLRVTFRVNRDREVRANRIIDWGFGVGQQRIRYGGEAEGARWVYGEPVRFELRWARNGRDVPVWAGSNAIVNPEARTVTFHFDNQWSLLRLLQQHRVDPADVAGAGALRSHTLGFRIDTERAGETTTETLPPTRVYIQLALSTPEQNGRRVVLPDFPVAAPSLEMAVPAEEMAYDP